MKTNQSLTIKRIAAMALSMLLSIGALAVSAEEAIIDEYYEDAYEDSYYSYPSGGNTSSDVSDVDLQTALAKVKKRLTIPESLTEFDYKVSTYNGTTTYRFTWYMKDEDVLAIPAKSTSVRTMNATIVGDVITNVDINANSYENSNRLGKLDPSKFEESANKILEKLNPGMSKKIEYGNFNAELFGKSIRVRFDRIEHGVIVSGNNGNVTFDKDTGALIGFRVNWWDNATFKDAAGKLPETTIEKNFAAAIKWQPAYEINRDYSNKTITSEIVYSLSDNYEFDGFTGKKTTMYDDIAKAQLTDVAYPATGASNDAGVETAESAAMDDADVAFSPEEQKAIEANSKLITKEKAVEYIAADPYINYTKEYELTGARLYSDKTFTEINTWLMSFRINTKEKQAYLSVTVDADTGKILKFSKNHYGSYYGDDYIYEEAVDEEPVDDDGNPIKVAPQPLFDVKKANAKALEAAKYYMGDKFTEYQPGKNNTAAVPVNEKTKEPYKVTSRTMTYNRYHENIIVNGERANITVSNHNEVMAMSYTYTDVKFPEAKILTQEQAFEKLWAQRDFKLYYTGFTDGGKAYSYLMYRLEDVYLNARTGAVCYSNGRPIEVYKQEDEISYSDLNSLSAELKKMVTLLQTYNITLDPISGKFAKDSPVTERQYYNILSRIGGVYYDSTYEEQNNLDKYSNSDKSLTNRNAAKIFTGIKGVAATALIKGIYKSPYTDVKDSDPDVGYICIMYGMGELPESKTFNPDGYMTREMAIRQIYNIFT
jgi:hypothetical protein